jgi:L-ascorbate metabolism protein UlaG (beta-lactamase superfamily)
MEFFFNQSKRSVPKSALPSVKTDLKALPDTADVLIWMGHSSYFIRLDGRTFLVDPVLSGNASPVTFTTKSFPGADIYTVDDLPDIDHLIITHDHWDHLDYKTILKLRPKVGSVITGLGTGAHLEYWGYEPGKIIERDWYDEIDLSDGFRITVLPARHFSGRGFTRDQSLWCSFALQAPTANIYIGGDSGYDKHYKEIGVKYGPFDLAILECGQYNKGWQYIHMLPDEVVVAAHDLRAKRLLPVHWSKFALALHDWDEPILKVKIESQRTNTELVHPLIGETMELKQKQKFKEWWQNID